jgi:hypothetical protein
MSDLIPAERIENKIYLIRGQKVMLDRDLAALYGVKTKVLNQAVKRNDRRFPNDFMFQLTNEEALEVLLITRPSSRSQSVTLKRGKNIKYLPYVFTEQGIAMLSSVLNSEQAIQVNIAIMRVFIKLKQILSTHKELAQKIKELENKFEKHDIEIQGIFDAIRKLMAPPEKSKRKIGFDSNN